AGPVEDLEDLILAVDVIAHRQHVHARVDQLLVAAERQPGPAGSVLAITDHQAQAPAGDEPGQDLAHDLATWRPHDIADEQNFQRHALAHSFPGRTHRNRTRPGWPASRPEGAGPRRGGAHRANSTVRVSRSTVTLTSPG